MASPVRRAWHARNRYLKFASDDESFAAIQSALNDFIAATPDAASVAVGERPEFLKEVPDFVAFALDLQGDIHAASLAVVQFERDSSEICYTARLAYLFNDQRHSQTLIARTIGVEAAKRCVAHFLDNFVDSDLQIAFEADWADHLGDAGRQFSLKFADSGLALAKRKIPRLRLEPASVPKP